MMEDGGGVLLSKRHEDGIQTESLFMKSPSVPSGSRVEGQTSWNVSSKHRHRVLKTPTSFTSSTLNIPMKCKAGNWDVMESLRKE